MGHSLQLTASIKGEKDVTGYIIEVSTVGVIKETWHVRHSKHDFLFMLQYLERNSVKLPSGLPPLHGRRWKNQGIQERRHDLNTVLAVLSGHHQNPAVAAFLGVNRKF